MAETRCKKYLPVLDPTRCPIDYSEEPEVCQAEVIVPSTPGGTFRLVKLYCDEISDYYTRKIRGWLLGNINIFKYTRQGQRLVVEYQIVEINENDDMKT